MKKKKCQIVYCDKYAIDEPLVEIGRLPPIKMPLCATHIGLFVTSELEREIAKDK